MPSPFFGQHPHHKGCLAPSTGVGNQKLPLHALEEKALLATPYCHPIVL